jgi:hypothetical protein
MKYSFSTILKTGLLVGTLDILAAFTQYYLTKGKNPLVILNYVASGYFGPAAFTTGNSMLLTGLLFHYFIAMSFAVFFFLIYPGIRIFHKSILLTASLYGLFMWAITNLLIVPFSKINKFPSSITNSIIAALILIVFIGIPLSMIAAKKAKKTS